MLAPPLAEFPVAKSTATEAPPKSNDPTSRIAPVMPIPTAIWPVAGADVGITTAAPAEVTATA